MPTSRLWSSLNVNDVSLARIGAIISLYSESNSCKIYKVVSSLVSDRLIRLSSLVSFLTIRRKSVTELEPRWIMASSFYN